jgi:spermidine/putrescine transport system substrate-binding protein
MSDPERGQIERAINRYMRNPMSRRSFLRQTGRGGIALGTALSLPAILAACAPGTTSSGSASGGPQGAVTLEWANWPLYIDIDEDAAPDPTPYPSLNTFIHETGINVHYVEAINDNEEFYGTIQPDLAAGNATGWDIVSPTSWMVKRMAELGYLEELDHSKLPNWTANCAD